VTEILSDHQLPVDAISASAGRPSRAACFAANSSDEVLFLEGKRPFFVGSGLALPPFGLYLASGCRIQ
jgi:hypothetical protein